MLDWIDWIDWFADFLLNAGAVVASWFVSKDATNFMVLQMMIATLVLGAIVSVVVYWQSLVDYWKSRRMPRK
jgi:hypothetical protein